MLVSTYLVTVTFIFIYLKKLCLIIIIIIFLKGIKEGWYDGGSIAFAVILVIVVTGIEWNASLKIFIFYYIRG